MQVASGLAAAHARGLVHRDVKPANILLERGTGRALLTDFGLARAVDDAGATQSGVIPGTPQYMAPEQARGEGADFRSDLFSLGSTLYAMCTGEPPFGADSPLAILRRVCGGQSRPVWALAPATPVWLVALIDRLHATNPADRFADAGEVEEVLSGCLAHCERPGAAPLPRALRGNGAGRRARRIRGAALGALLACCLGAVAAIRWPPAGDPEAPQEGAPVGAPSPAKTAPKPNAEGSLEGQLRELRRRAGALEADLKRPAGEPNDAAGEVLRDVRRRLDALERELGAPP
jgi:serine/threonine-protein kinase